MSAATRFEVVRGADLDSLLRALGERGGFTRRPTRHLRATVYDTFDWRIRVAGGVLEHQVDETGRAEVVWRPVGGGASHGRIELDAVPRFVRDLPAGPVRERLAEVVEMRALLPLATYQVERTTLALTDDEGKTIARVLFDVPSGPPLAGRPASVELVPVRGYAKAVTRIGDLLDAQVWLNPGGDDPADVALAASGHVVGSYSSKLDLAFGVDSSAGDAWVAVLDALDATFLANEAGVRSDLDSEFLHDFRVAVRRTRSVLSQSKRILAPDARDRFRADFGWLGQQTGPTRDYDVFLLELPAFAAALPADRRGDLSPFAQFLTARQRAAHVELVTALDSPRYAAMVADWRRFLDSPRFDTSERSLAARRADEVAAARIVRAHHAVVRDGRAIDHATAPEALHQLRKDAKKLRYLLECFGSLFDRDDVGRIVRQLKGLQDVLGEYQDCQVQVEALGSFAQQMLDDDGAAASTLLAMGGLIDDLAAREEHARAGFHERFDRFDTKKVARAVTHLVPEPAEPEEEP